jgi:hypothetical protein
MFDTKKTHLPCHLYFVETLHVQFQQSTGKHPDDGPIGLKHVGVDVIVFKDFNI